jgi:hypothetical protein
MMAKVPPNPTTTATRADATIENRNEEHLELSAATPDGAVALVAEARLTRIRQRSIRRRCSVVSNA